MALTGLVALDQAMLVYLAVMVASAALAKFHAPVEVTVAILVGEVPANLSDWPLGTVMVLPAVMV